MPNTFNVANWITMEALRSLLNNLVIAESFNTDYNKEYQQTYPIGEELRIKLPWRPKVSNGLGYKEQGINRVYTTVTVDQVFGVHFGFDSIEEALQLERGREAFKREYLDKAMEQIAQEIDSRAANWAYLNTNNIVGALGTNPTSMDTYNAARARMVEHGCPPGMKRMVLSPGMQRSIANALATVFNPTSKISAIFRKGMLAGEAQGFDDWFESMSLYSHTAGTWAGAVTVNGAGQSGSSLNINCTSGDTFFAGDVYSIANVNSVNPATRRSTGSAKHFRVTESVTASGSTATLSIAPAIVGPGSDISDGHYQNVDALPANAAALTLFPGTTSPNGKSGINGLALHRDAFALVGVKMEVPERGVILSSQTRDPKTGIAVRFIQDWDQQNSRKTNRIDVLLGFGNLYPDSCAVRVLSST